MTKEMERARKRVAERQQLKEEARAQVEKREERLIAARNNAASTHHRVCEDKAAIEREMWLTRDKYNTVGDSLKMGKDQAIE